MAKGNINEFVAAIRNRGGVARSNRFQVHMNIGGFDDSGRDLSLLCESASFPGRTLSTVDYSLWRNPIKIPSGFTQEDVSMVFHLTNDYYVKTIFDKWLNSIVSNDDYFLEYETQDDVQKFKTDVYIYQLDEFDSVVYGVKLLDAYPIRMSDVSFSNSNSNETLKLTIDFTYSKWETIDLQAQPPVYLGTPDNFSSNIASA